MAPGLILTNWHVLRTAEWAQGATLTMDAEDDIRGVPMSPRVFSLDPAWLFLSDQALDFAFCAVAIRAVDGTPLSRYGHLRLFGASGKIVRSEYATNTSFLTAVKALLATAEDQKELLVRQGMADGLLADLAGRVSELEAAVESASTGRHDHIGARADLDAITQDLLDQVKVLDGGASYRLGNDPELMVEWNAAKAVGTAAAEEGAAGRRGWR